MQIAFRQMGLFLLGIGLFALAMYVAFAVDGSDLFRARSGISQTRIATVDGFIYDQQQ